MYFQISLKSLQTAACILLVASLAQFSALVKSQDIYILQTRGLLGILPNKNAHYVDPVGAYLNIDTTADSQLFVTLMTGDPKQKAQAVKLVLSSPDKHAPPVLLALPSALMAQGKKEEAIFWLWAARMRLIYDCYRCADQQAAREATIQLRYIIDESLENSLNSKIDTLRPTIDKVIAWETKTPHNYDQHWINLYNVQNLSEAEMSIPKNQWTDAQKKAETVLLELYNREVAFANTKHKEIAATANAPKAEAVSQQVAASTQQLELINTLLKKRAKLTEADPEYGTLLLALGKAYLDAGNPTKAEETLKQSIAVNLKDGASYQPVNAAESMSSLGFLYKKQNRLDEAYVEIVSVMPLAQTAFGPTDPRTKELTNAMIDLMLNSNLGKLTVSAGQDRFNGKYAESIEKYKNVLKIVAAQDPNCNLMSSTLVDIGRVYAEHDEYDKAEEALTKAIPTFKRYYPNLLPNVEKLLSEVKSKVQH